MKQFIKDSKSKGKEGKRPCKVFFLRSIKDTTERKKIAGIYNELVGKLTEDVCNALNLSWFWKKTCNGYSCVYTDGCELPPARKRVKRDKKEQEKEQIVGEKGREKDKETGEVVVEIDSQEEDQNAVENEEKEEEIENETINPDPGDSSNNQHSNDNNHAVDDMPEPE